MIPKYDNWAAAVLVAALACGTALVPSPTAAQMSPNARPMMDAMRDRMGGGPHVEGHIAFLKAELAITAAQAPLWDKVAAAMREDVARMMPAMAQAWADRQKPETALGYLETRAKLATLRADGEAHFLAAFRPLYEALSADQQKIADELLAHDHP